jgi:hypothetical protein
MLWFYKMVENGGKNMKKGINSRDAVCYNSWICIFGDVFNTCLNRKASACRVFDASPFYGEGCFIKFLDMYIW